MTFRSPSLLWILALVPLAIAFFYWRERVRTRVARRFVNERLRGVTIPWRALRPWLLGTALAFAVLALAGPFAGYRDVPIVARETNRVLVMDVSNSMGAEDVGTSRLSAAKALAIRLADAQSGRVGLVVFEGAPEVASPLTSDTAAVASLIDTITTGEVGEPGSDVGSALIEAMRLIESDPLQKSDIVVISDGEDQGTRVDEALRSAKLRSMTISTIVVGSGDGATIPTQRGPMRNDSGEPVVTRARTDVMAQIASSSGGRMLQNPFGADALDPLLRDTRNATERQTTARIPVERYQWPLALAFLAFFAGSLLHRGAE
jgi:Ca-activated chloride channel family protein